MTLPKQKAVLIITDGIGYSKQETFNAFKTAKKPTYDRLFKEVPYSLIETFGLSVGLPEGQMGNSEVGHMTLGAGRVLYQDLVKISLALKEGTFENNSVFVSLLETSNNLHIIGLLSDGGVHSHIEHIMGAAMIAKNAGKRVYLHLITDGRDVSPTSAKRYLKQLEPILDKSISIATLGGRFFTMDRDNRWDRVQKGYEAIVLAKEATLLTPLEYLVASYEKEETDEFILPTAFSGYHGMLEGDAVLSMNFRSDRVREIITALGDESFSGFEREFKRVHIATITEYDRSFDYPVLYKKEVPKNTLAEVVSKAGFSQLHTAETEKYAHVTFFLNGGVDEPLLNETRVLIPSPQVKTYDMQPEMSAHEVGKAVRDGIEFGHELIVVNFANGDMVGHTGNFEAAVKAVETVDEELGKIFKTAKEHDYAVVVTSDHGNCEEMQTADGKMLTNHTVGKVWCFVDAKGVTSVKEGALNNVAATVLELMGLDVPAEMDASLI